MEAPVKGLIEDSLDFKAITRSLSWRSGNAAVWSSSGKRLLRALHPRSLLPLQGAAR